jgi:hypothetical protein
MRAVLLAACLGGTAAGPAGAARTPGNRLQAESQLPLRAVYCTVPLRQQLQAARSEAAGPRPGSPARGAQAARAERNADRIAERLHAVNLYLAPRWRAIDDRYEQAAVRRGQADLAESVREARHCPQRCAAAGPSHGAAPPPAPAGARRAPAQVASAGRAACIARCEADAGPASGRIARCMDPDLLQD